MKRHHHIPGFFSLHCRFYNGDRGMSVMLAYFYHSSITFLKPSLLYKGKYFLIDFVSLFLLVQDHMVPPQKALIFGKMYSQDIKGLAGLYVFPRRLENYPELTEIS